MMANNIAILFGATEINYISRSQHLRARVGTFTTLEIRLDTRVNSSAASNCAEWILVAELSSTGMIGEVGAAPKL